MADENGEVDPTLFDSVILQVFEEQEERCGSLRYPLSTQRHALDFVKLINRKGFPYVLMCQAIDEKQEKFRSWRLGNGNAHIGVVMMKRINETVQEAMILPDADADVDIDDLIDDDDDDDDEAEIADDDLTTDEDDQHPTTSSSSSPPPPADRVDDETSVADTAATVDTTDSDTKTTSPTPTSPNEDDGSKDQTNELAETQISITELQSNEQQQQQPGINTDDVKLTTDNTGTDDVDLPEPSLTTNELQTEETDTSRQEDVEAKMGEGESPENEDYVNRLAENQPEACNDGDNKVQIYSSDTPDANQQVCQSTEAESTESGDVIPSTSSASATSALPTSSEHPEHVQVVSESQQESEPASEDQEQERNDTKYTAETADQTETEQHDGDVTDQNDQNDLQVTSQLELEVKDDHESDSLTTQTEEDQSTPMTEKQEQSTVQVETAVGSEEHSLISAGDEMTSQQDAEVGHEEVKVTSETEVTEQAEVTEEVKVTYEASAKQLDLLSRLAMLREKAAQRKAQSADTQDSHETSSCEDHGLSGHTDDSTRSPDQPGTSQQKDDAPYILKHVVDINKDKETSPETDKQKITATVDADAEQQFREGTGSPLHVTVETEDKSQQGQLVSETNDHCRSTGSSSSSVTVHNDTVETEPQTQSTAEHVSLTTADKSTTETHSEHGEAEAAEALDVQTTTTHSGSDNTNTSTKEAADLELIGDGSNSTDTNSHKEDEFCTTFAAMGSAVDLQSTDRDLPQHGLSQAPSDTADSETSDVKTAENCSSVQTDDSSLLTTEQTETEKPTDSELCDVSTAAILPESSVDSSSYPSGSNQRESAASEPSSEPTHLADDDSGNAAINYDSDLDREFIDTDALQLLSDIETLKSSTADGPGYLYVFADPPKRRFMTGSSRSPAKRLRQATVFNPDLTLLVCVPVSRRLAAVRELRRRLVANHSRDVITACLPGSRDWFTGSDHVITQLVMQVAAAADTTN